MSRRDSHLAAAAEAKVMAVKSVAVVELQSERKPQASEPKAEAHASKASAAKDIPEGTAPPPAKAPKAEAAADKKAAPAKPATAANCRTPALATRRLCCSARVSTTVPNGAEPEPEPEPPTTGKGTPKTFQMNRNSVLKQYLLAAGWREATKGERAQFAHWDAHTKNGPANAEIDCFPRSATNCIDNIWTFYKRVEEIGMAKDGFPETFFDWRSLDEDTIASSPIWFLKNVFGVHGNGIRLVGSWDEYQAALKDTPKKPMFLYGPSGEKEVIDESHYLQRGLVNCHLYRGRKYLLRVYYLALGDGRVYIYDDALGYAHGEKFRPMEKTWGVHVSHVNVPGKDKKPKADNRIYFNLSTMERGAEVMEKIMAHSKRHVNIIQETITVSQKHPKPDKRVNSSHYHLWGVDYLIGEEDGELSAWCIELNAFPNMNHNNPRKGSTKQQNEVDFRASGFDRDMLRMLGLEEHGNAPPSRWVELVPTLASTRAL